MKKIKLFAVITFFSTFVFSLEDESENKFSIHSATTVFRAIGESKTEFEFQNSDSNSIDSMHAVIHLYRDSETQRQSAAFAFNGERTTNNPRLNFGGEWNIPVFLFNHSEENRFIGDSIISNDMSFQAAAVSLGFVAKNTNDNFPFRFSTGPSFEGGLRQSERDTIFGGGGYFSIFGGDTLGSRIWDTPFLFRGSLFGRYIKSEQNNRNLASNSKLVYDRNGIFSTDTLAIFVRNAITLGEVNSQIGYINSFSNREIPNIYSNNLSVVFRATEVGNAFFEPSFELLLSDNRYRYLNNDKFYGSLKKNTVSALTFLNKEFGAWDFETGFRISGTREENAYFSGNGRGAGTAIDTLNEKLNNANVFNPQFYFLSRFSSPSGFAVFGARYVIERNRRIFPFSFEQNGLEISNNSDFDNVSQQIKLQNDFFFTNWYNLFLSAERLRNQIYFLNGEMSAASRTEERYALEIGNTFSRDSAIIFSVSGLATAAPQRYFFSDFDDLSLPSHNRLFGISSDLWLNWNNGWGNNLSFSTTKFDRGVIQNGNYYGIEEKQRETITGISLSRSHIFFILAGGFEVNIRNTQNFDYDENQYFSFGNSYLLSPFTSGSFAIKNNLMLDFFVKRNISKGLSLTKNFWDISVNLSAYF